MSGPIDGEGKFQGTLFTGSGSVGYPDAGIVLRSYLKHPAFEVLFTADELGSTGAVKLGGPDVAGDVLAVQVRTVTGMRHTDLSFYGQAVNEASDVAMKHLLDGLEAQAGVLLYRVGAELEADLVITGREWLLAERRGPNRKRLASVVSAEEAVAYWACTFAGITSR